MNFHFTLGILLLVSRGLFVIQLDLLLGFWPWNHETIILEIEVLEQFNMIYIFSYSVHFHCSSDLCREAQVFQTE